jgi:GH15 family glucan-1,4-alpha-glucosidase
MALKIEQYAIIGDCETAALVGLDGSLDWLCWPRFDSAACFAALVGSPDNGRWLLTPADPAAHMSRRYRDCTLILETEVATADGRATIIDFMPPREKASDVVRLVRGTSGRVSMRTELCLRFDYGSLVPWVSRGDDGAHFFVEAPDMAVLRTPAKLRREDRKVIGDFTVTAGQTVPFVLTYGRAHLPPPDPIDPEQALRDTEDYWRNWVARARPAGPWSDAVIRSLITLKACTHRPTGAIVASVTSSLPERLGGTRNWDYRFCWLRDATFTLIAMMNAGFTEDARAWRHWLLRTAAGAPERLQIMYGVAGEHRLPEWEIPWLDGYQGSKPVRAGNAAYQQTQIDVYGELMDALHHGRQANLGSNEDGWEMQRQLMDHLETIWEEPDHGIWEVRGDRQRFTNSKIMAWVAFDRAIKTVEQFKLGGPVERWRAIRRKIHEEVCRYGFNPEINAFVQSYGSKHLDASALLIPLVGFLPAHDDRVRATVKAIEKDLMVDGLLVRYDTQLGVDGLPPGEGVFLACSFWYADNLALLGRRREACDMFERLLSLRNDVGLLSEEYDPYEKRLLGNFPQAISHIPLINTAYLLSQQSKHHRHAPDKRTADAAHPLGANSE